MIFPSRKSWATKEREVLFDSRGVVLGGCVAAKAETAKQKEIKTGCIARMNEAVWQGKLAASAKKSEMPR